LVRDQYLRLRQRNAALKSDLGNAEQRVRDLQRQLGMMANAAAQMEYEMDTLRCDIQIETK
jgi:uncharacterized protein YeeX (DUF496 family)